MMEVHTKAIVFFPLIEHVSNDLQENPSSYVSKEISLIMLSFT